MRRPKILVVDDEQDLCEILKFNLENEGFQVDTANSAEEALTLDLSQYQLLILDVMMGEMSGFAMAKSLKQDPALAATPVIFLTARSTENDTITGFSLGADDYIAKPFSIREVVMRVKAVLHRTCRKTEEPDALLSYNGLEMNLEKKTVSVGGTSIPFTKTEFELLRVLLENRGHLFSRQELINRIWPRDVFVVDRTVDVNITRIRKKLGPYGKNIVTRLGFGYYFDE
ncbi:response regulator transcription factor [Prevotella sp. KH2C16]|uniref:response regulator transcription factor n=1 Tax=Prevotella sp. KH2C16 TaxID=1855325 RepID=UPI0008E31FED|nr:response regulator transcription factor [Prevotella sp. KH2C16]SFG42308.1 DNA-binding response regulator, OmpR family, contains REC and winged-helix (wHTH) domain [Prevotella sp. KH2C16]